ncbi:hypothetical protein ACFO4O_13940 [Glaciecola siphonariae]|uniref:Uncharacterized protein n=1 Tax=Glaciecola siphonariae TaxID=521012 RepID=A0ABV9LZI9_9ALTE
MITHVFLALLFNASFMMSPSSESDLMRLGNSQYFVDQTVSSYSNEIVYTDEYGNTKTVIGPSILAFIVNEDFLIGSMQHVEHYICDRTSRVAIQEEVEYFVLDFSKSPGSIKTNLKWNELVMLDVEFDKFNLKKQTEESRLHAKDKKECLNTQF